MKQTISTLVNTAIFGAVFLAACLDCRTPALAQARAESVQDINAPYRQPDLDVEVWVERFEGEGREAFDFRHEITAAIGLRPGQDIADVGAGTGLFVPLFADRAGPAGTVYAVDIVPDFIEHITRQAEQRGLDNVRPVLSGERSIMLPADSVDVVFVCDAYHHFEFYQDMLASIRAALRPGGELIIVEYDKEPGTDDQWLRDHIRATEEEFTSEIEANGFRFVEEVEIEGFTRTFFRRFKES